MCVTMHVCMNVRMHVYACVCMCVPYACASACVYAGIVLAQPEARPRVEGVIRHEGVQLGEVLTEGLLRG